MGNYFTKIARSPINNFYPSADAPAILASLQDVKLSLKDDPFFPKITRKAYDKFGVGGVAATTALKALKPSNAIDLIFGNGDALIDDIGNDVKRAQSRYRGSAAAFLPASIMAPFNKDARALYIQRQLRSNLKDFQKKAKIPITVAKISAGTVLLATILKRLSRRPKTDVHAVQQFNHIDPRLINI